MIKSIISSRAPAAIGPYSQAIQYRDLIFCSGQIGLNPTTGEMAEEIEAQTEQALKNLRAVLGEAGSGMHQVVKTTVFLTDIKDFAKMNKIYTRYFTGQKPARSTVEVANLPKRALVEIEAIAVVR